MLSLFSVFDSLNVSGDSSTNVAAQDSVSSSLILPILLDRVSILLNEIFSSCRLRSSTMRGGSHVRLHQLADKPLRRNKLNTPGAIVLMGE